MPITLSDSVRDVLGRSTITATTVSLPQQLDRKLYLEVDKALRAAGGTWHRKDRVHVFARDPREVLGLAVAGGSIVDPKRDLGKFYTPAWLADIVATLVAVDDGSFDYPPSLLEPNVGGGALVDAVRRIVPAARFDVYDVDPDVAVPGSYTILWREDFLRVKLAPEHYDGIVMNPPFGRGAALKHVLHAAPALKPGRRLVAILPSGVEQRGRTRYERAFKALYDRWAGHICGKFPDAFQCEGTRVSVCVVVLTKPASAAS